MGLFDWFRSAATAAGDKEDISAVPLEQGESAELAGLNFQEAVAAHQRWKVRLRACLDGNSQEKLDPVVVSQDNQCVLGKWIHGQGAATFGDKPTFIELRAVHAEFHQIAGGVLSAVYEGRKAEAEEMLGSDFSRTSIRIVMLLANLFIEARQ